MIKHKKILTILTIIIGFVICCFLLFYSGEIATNNGCIVYQHNCSGAMFLCSIGTLWLVGFLCYKVYVLEHKIDKLAKTEMINAELLGCVTENIDKILKNQTSDKKQSEADFVELMNFSQNTRELLLHSLDLNRSKE